MTPFDWLMWGCILGLQNYTFTFVSRARNSGSLKRHMIASFLSNGVWFASQLVLLGPVIDMIKGSQGYGSALLAGSFYTGCTMLGSYVAHAVALSNEKGSSAVGANKRFKQVTVEEWEQMKSLLDLFGNVRTSDYIVLSSDGLRLGFRNGLLTSVNSMYPLCQYTNSEKALSS